MAERPTKQQRISEAREQAKLAREARERRAKRLRVLVPSLVSLALVAIVVIVVVVIAIQPKPAPVAANGPKNMVSDGIVLTGVNGKVVATQTPGITKGDSPTPTSWPTGDTRMHIETYIDWTCPICKTFETSYGDAVKKLVTSGAATLEVHPVAILDKNYTTNYSTRAANAAACVANYDPDEFLDVQAAMYANQASEGSSGLTDQNMITIIHTTGLTDDKVDSCIRGSSFKNWVSATTTRAVSDDALKQTIDGQTSFGTPTIVVNGKLMSTTDFVSLLKQLG